MSCNVGRTDRIVRAVLGILIIGAGFYFSIWLAAVGLILLVTAAISWCPIYAIFGLSTCPTRGTAAGNS